SREGRVRSAYTQLAYRNRLKDARHYERNEMPALIGKRQPCQPIHWRDGSWQDGNRSTGSACAVDMEYELHNQLAPAEAKTGQFSRVLAKVGGCEQRGPRTRDALDRPPA